MKYKVRIGEKEFEVEKKDNSMLVNGKITGIDLVQTGSGEFHILSNSKRYAIEVLDYNAETREYTLRVNGKKNQVVLQDELDIMLSGMGMNAGAGKKARELKAPMPGLVVEVLVSAGQTVKKGEPLIILEAMKMENILKAGTDVVIGKIEVQKGNAVEKNQLLITFQ